MNSSLNIIMEIAQLTKKQFDKLVLQLSKLTNEQLALLNFECWNEARNRGAKQLEEENGNCESVGEDKD